MLRTVRSGMLVVTATLLLVADGAAAARLPAERVATAASRVQTDARFAVWLRADGDAQVVDTRRDRTSVIDLPDGCTSFDVGGGHLSVNCGGPTDEPLVHRLATGRRVAVAGWDDYVAAAFARQLRPSNGGPIGRTWMRVTAAAHHGGELWYLRWGTGELLTAVPSRATDVENLDGANPRRRLCAPLRRRPAPADEVILRVEPYRDYEYDRPWGVAETARGARLERCGRRRSRRLPCQTWACELGTGALSYVAGRQARIRELRCGREDAMVPQPRWDPTATAHTRHALFVSVVPLRTDPTAPFEVAIYRADRTRCR